MSIDVGELIHQLGISPPFRLLDVVRGWLVGAMDCRARDMLRSHLAEPGLAGQVAACVSGVDIVSARVAATA